MKTKRLKAGLYESIGKYAQAEPLYVRALAIVEQSLGTNHLNTQTVRENLEILQQQLVPPMNWWEKLRGKIEKLGK